MYVVLIYHLRKLLSETIGYFHFTARMGSNQTHQDLSTEFTFNLFNNEIT